MVRVTEDGLVLTLDSDDEDVSVSLWKRLRSEGIGSRIHGTMLGLRLITCQSCTREPMQPIMDGGAEDEEEEEQQQQPDEATAQQAAATKKGKKEKRSKKKGGQGKQKGAAAPGEMDPSFAFDEADDGVRVHVHVAG